MKKGLILVVEHEEPYRATPTDGLILRAVGRGFQVCLIRFAEGLGEIPATSQNRIKEFLDVHELWKNFQNTNENLTPPVEDLRAAWKEAVGIISSGHFHLVILEELSTLLDHDAISEAEVLQFLRNRPPDQHIAITGTNIPEWLASAADTVTHIATVRAQPKSEKTLN